MDELKMDKKGVLVVFGSAPLWRNLSCLSFGLGFERLIMYVTGMANIRDVLPFPRTTGSAEF